MADDEDDFRDGFVPPTVECSFDWPPHMVQWLVEGASSYDGHCDMWESIRRGYHFPDFITAEQLQEKWRMIASGLQSQDTSKDVTKEPRPYEEEEPMVVPHTRPVRRCRKQDKAHENQAVTVHTATRKSARINKSDNVEALKSPLKTLLPKRQNSARMSSVSRPNQVISPKPDTPTPAAKLSAEHKKSVELLLLGINNNGKNWEVIQTCYFPKSSVEKLQHCWSKLLVADIIKFEDDKWVVREEKFQNFNT